MIKLTAYSSLVLSFLCFFSYAKTNIAVLDFEGRGITTEEALTLSDKLRGDLIKTDSFTVIERGQMNQILKEQGFQQAGCTSQECAVEMGQLIGVDRITAGSIGKVGKTFLVSLRMIDISTGKIIRNVDEEIKGEIDDVLGWGIKSVALKMAGADPKPAQAPVQTVTKKKSGFPFGWIALGVLLAGGAGAGYYYSQQQSNEAPADEVKTGTVNIDWETL
jgi:TolB-like protein